MHIDPQSKHGWQALRYAARHLTDAEQREFETRLCEDQAARDAVAQAVELAHTATFLHLDSETELSDLTAVLRAAPVRSTLDAALQAATPADEAAPQRATTATWTHKAGWWSAAAAACVALVALWSANNNSTPPAAPAASTQQVTTDITNAWADLNTQRMTSLEPAEEVASENLPTVRELSRDSDDAIVLDWLLNGLRQEALTPGERGSEIPRTN